MTLGRGPRPERTVCPCRPRWSHRLLLQADAADADPRLEVCVRPFLLGLITAQMVAAHLCGYRTGRAAFRAGV